MVRAKLSGGGKDWAWMGVGGIGDGLHLWILCPTLGWAARQRAAPFSAGQTVSRNQHLNTWL